MTTIKQFSETSEEIAEKIARLTLKDAADTIQILKEKYNISAETVAFSAAAPAAASGDAQPASEEKTEFSVHLTGFGSQKVTVIRQIKDILKLSLGDAKAAVESTANGPYEIKTGVSKEEAGQIKKQLEEAGASVEIK